MTDEWQGPWWSRNPEYDTQTYRILSSPDLLSSTSPSSQQDHISPNRLAKSSIDSNEPPCVLSRDDSQKLIVRKYTYSHADASRKQSETDSEYDKYSVDVTKYKNEGRGEVCQDLKGEVATARECNVKKTEERETFNKDGCIVEVLRTTTVTTTTHTADTERSGHQRVEAAKCVYELLTDPESSENPSPELESGVTLESVSDDQMDHKVEVQKFVEDDGDRKDSNTSNITNISTLTTDTNFSTISETTATSDCNTYTTEEKPEEAGTTSRRRSCTDQFSLIENYPPKERKSLQKEVDHTSSSTGSDTSAGGPSPPPVRAPPSAAKYRPPPSAKLSRQGSVKLSRQNSVAGLNSVKQHKHTMSLSHLDDGRKNSAKPSRSAITP